MDNEKATTIAISLRNCPPPIKAKMERFSLNFFHARGYEPNIVKHDEDDLFLEINFADLTKEQQKELHDEWGQAMGQEAVRLTQEYVEEYGTDFFEQSNTEGYWDQEDPEEF